MWEKTFEEIELESQPRSLLCSLPFLKEKADPVAIFLIAVGSAFVVIVALKIRIFHLWAEFLQSTSFLRISTYPLLISAVIIASGIIFRTVLWFRYKPDSLETGESVEWPYVSIIMPALNEEELISKAIDSIFASNYPEDKLEVIAINDGSSDLTFPYMMKAKRKYGERLRVINFKKNMGKRKALYSGLKVSRGNIVVTVDTDSKIGRSAIKNLVIPLIKDDSIGAVAGRVAALNERENFLTRMLSIRYSISFDFGRAYQSVYGTVFVCPGALAAYRKNVLYSFVKEWLNQRFMNTPCLHGEDRALTTYILRAGYFTKYQSNAVVYTRVPSKFLQMNRMYIRWTRSYVRESVVFASFMFSRYRRKHRVLPVLDFVFLNLLHPFHIFSVFVISYSFFIHPMFILRHLAFLVIMSFFLSLYYLRTNKSLTFLYGIPYAMITAFLLWWIIPFSALTLRNQSWMTR
jgi:hyaluronan synthase